jgi:hypothetical protein
MSKEETCSICGKPLTLREYTDTDDGPSGYAHTDCLDGTAQDEDDENDD